MTIDEIEAMTQREREAFASRIELEMARHRTADYKPSPQKGRGRKKGSLLPAAPPPVEVSFVPVVKPRRSRRHGTVSGYNAGCKCEPCMTAKTAYQRANSRKLIVERAAPFHPIRRPSATSMPFEHSTIASLDEARARAAEAS